jgi:hypothetical protein
MHSRKRLANVIDQIIMSEQENLEEVESTIVDDYKKLNEKCEATITNIKIRKSKSKSKVKKNIQQTGE